MYTQPVVCQTPTPKYGEGPKESYGALWFQPPPINSLQLSHGFHSYIISLRYQCPSAAAFRGPSASLGCSLFCFRLPLLLPRSVVGRFSGPCFRESSAKGPRRLPPRLARTPFSVDFVWLVKVNLISDVGLL